VSEFQIYTGTTGQTTEKHLGARVIQNPTKHPEGKNIMFILTITLCLDTMEKKRGGLPQYFKNHRHMKRGKSDVTSNSSGITPTLCKDRKSIMFLSDFHNPAAARKIKMKL
jgi:hypothetical protein